MKTKIFGNYIVDELGNVYSLFSNKILKQQSDRYGYLYVTLTIDKKQKKFKVHRLVAKCFIEDNSLCVDHIDRNKLNNHCSNLRYVTPKENSNNPNTIAHLKEVGIKYKKEYGKKVKDSFNNEYISIIEASRITGIPRSNIQYHLKNETGRWEYAQTL